MALKTLVKISSVNNLSDARYCAGMAVDLMGFDLNPESANYVNFQEFMELTGWISGVRLVGEFPPSAKADKIIEDVRSYDLTAIQLGNSEQVKALSNEVKTILFRFDLDQLANETEVAETMKELAPYVEYFVFESEKDVQYKAHIEDAVINLAEVFPVIIGFNLDDKKASTLLEKSQIKGLSLKGGQEIRPGYKDFDELADILESLELED